MASPIWSIVLAGGEGRRLQPLIRNWLGEERPKQYCTFVGSRSMLDHTWDRACALSGAARVVTVVAAGHRRYLAGAHEAPGPLVEQPRNCGTGPGVFLPATLVAAQHPTATLLVLPADHFIYPERSFLAQAEAACRMAAERPGKIVLLGAQPRYADGDYGWIVPAEPPRGGEPLPVESFEEKPGPLRAADYFARGALWNTMVMAMRADTLWQLGERLQPAMMRCFAELLRVLAHPAWELPAVRIREAIAAAYRRMPHADFSRDLVQRAPRSAVVVPLQGVDWCDWGRPERVAETLLRLGKRPAFPVAQPIEDDGLQVWPAGPAVARLEA